MVFADRIVFGEHFAVKITNLSPPKKKFISPFFSKNKTAEIALILAVCFYLLTTKVFYKQADESSYYCTDGCYQKFVAYFSFFLHLRTFKRHTFFL